MNANNDKLVKMYFKMDITDDLFLVDYLNFLVQHKVFGANLKEDLDMIVIEMNIDPAKASDFFIKWKGHIMYIGEKN